MDSLLTCPDCGQQFSVDSPSDARITTCPTCGRDVQISAAQSSAPNLEDSLFCTKCGQRNRENHFKCMRCGCLLHEPPPPQFVVTDDGTMGGLIPYKNAQALWAYYLGVFSLVPCIGIPLGIAALVLGIRGLSFANRNPEAKGRVHAWTGIILGGLAALVYSLLVGGTILAGALD